MSDNASLDNQELDDFERSLMSIELRPTSKQRDQLLYACGYAAGRALMQRRLRMATAVAASCLVISNCLTFVILGRHAAGSIAQSTPNEAPAPRKTFPLERDGKEKIQVERQLHLNAGSSFDEFLELDRAGRSQAVANSGEPDSTAKSVLTVSGGGGWVEL